MSAIAGFHASIYATTTPAVAFTHEAMTDSGDHKTFTITNQVKRYWDDTVALVVESTTDGTTWTATTAYKAQFVGGAITLNAALTGTPGLRVSGSYLPYSLIGGAKSVDITHTLDVLDSTTFADGGWKTKVVSLAGSQYKVSRWWLDQFFVTALDTKRKLVLSAHSGANANQRYDAYAYIKQSAIKIAINALETEDIDFEVDGAVYAYL